MHTSIKGKVLSEGTRPVIGQKLDEFAAALGTPTAAQTARLVPFFGPTFMAGEAQFVEALELDLNRALLAGIEYEWTRPFEAGEIISFRTFVEDAYAKSNMVFAVVTSEFNDVRGELVQRQRATFVEREAA